VVAVRDGGGGVAVERVCHVGGDRGDRVVERGIVDVQGVAVEIAVLVCCRSCLVLLEHALRRGGRAGRVALQSL
jgi:hypothetical protein